jgi:hypothetical protein
MVVNDISLGFVGHGSIGEDDAVAYLHTWRVMIVSKQVCTRPVNNKINDDIEKKLVRSSDSSLYVNVKI